MLPANWSGRIATLRCSLIEELNGPVEILRNAAAQFMRPRIHSVGIILGDGFIEPYKGSGVVEGHADAFIVGASEQRLGLRFAFGGPGLRVLDRVGVMARLPICIHGQGLGIVRRPLHTVWIGIDRSVRLLQPFAKLRGTGRVGRPADTCVEVASGTATPGGARFTGSDTHSGAAGSGCRTPQR